MTQSHCESSPGSHDECRTASDGCQPLDEADRLEPLARLQAAMKLHPPSPCIITQPKSWYSFYHPTEGRRLSRPRWLVTYPDGLPACEQSPIQVVTKYSKSGSSWIQSHYSIWTERNPTIWNFQNVILYTRRGLCLSRKMWLCAVLLLTMFLTLDSCWSLYIGPATMTHQVLEEYNSLTTTQTTNRVTQNC